MYLVSFLVSAFCFGAFVHSNYKSPWFSTLFVFNLLLGINGMIAFFVK